MVRELHVVRLSADGRQLLLGATRDGPASYSVAADGRLDRALRGQDPDSDVLAAVPISPRDIQARLRAGATVEEVAADAGVPVARVERFAGPVRSELEQVVGEARRAFLQRTRAGTSARALGDAVAINLSAITGARLETVHWQAARQPDGCWQVSLRVVVRGRSRLARWRYRTGDRDVLALDAYATQLGFVDPAGRAPLDGTSAASRKPTGSARASARKGAGTNPSAPTSAAKTTGAKTTGAKRAATKATTSGPSLGRRR